MPLPSSTSPSAQFQQEAQSASPVEGNPPDPNLALPLPSLEILQPDPASTSESITEAGQPPSDAQTNLNLKPGIQQVVQVLETGKGALRVHAETTVFAALTMLHALNVGSGVSALSSVKDW